MKRLALGLGLLAAVAGRLPAQTEEIQGIMLGPAQPAQLKVPEKVDPSRDVERVLVFGSHGPVLLEVAIRIDGNPYLTEREQLVDDVLKLATPKDGGKPTWKAAAASKRLQACRVGNRLSIFVQGEMMAKPRSLEEMYDKNKDGLIDRYEARLFVVNEAGGPALRLGAIDGAEPTGAVPHWSLFDADKDGKLSAAELDAIPRKLLKHDANDDEAISLAELDGARENNDEIELQLLTLLNSPPGAGSDRVFLLGPLADYQELAKAFAKHHARIDLKDRAALRKLTPLLADLVEKLDKNNDGKLDANELAGLETAPPHLKLHCQLNEGKAPAIALDKTDFMDKRVADATHSFDLQGTRVHINPEQLGSAFRVAFAGAANFEALDLDKNGTIEGDEIDKNKEQRAQILAWDLDEDGKVTRQEHDEYHDRQKAATRGRVGFRCGTAGQRLFDAFDVNGDGQLGLREIREAAKNLRRLDRDHDGAITQLELPPAAIEVDVNLEARGYFGGSFVLADRVSPRVAKEPPSKGPIWFRKMDHNGDGDVSRREFVGAQADFERLDKNRDGFVDRAEAEAADKERK